MATKHDIKYSSNSDPEKVAAEVTHLTDGQGRWIISATKAGLEREFKFKTFKTTWAFMNAVAEQAAKKKHHPEWSNVRFLPSPISFKRHPNICQVYNTTFIRWTTHHPAGLSQLDVDLAAFCDKQATEMGELIPKQPHQSIQEGIVASEAAEVRAVEENAAKEGKAPGEAMKEKLGQSEAEARGEDSGGVVGSKGMGKRKAEGEESGMCGLTDRVVKGAGDCCVPKSARKAQNAQPEDRESKIEKAEGGDA